MNSRFDFIRGFDDQQTSLHGTIPATSAIQNEEDRTKQPSIFQIIRELKHLFASDEDQFFGLYGAFGFDLIYQFEQLAKEKKRPDDQKDLVLYLPDELTIVDHHLSIAYTLSYDVQVNNESTNHLERTGQCIPYERGTISRETPYKKRLLR